MSAANKRFGQLLREGIVSVARKQGCTKAEVEQQIAQDVRFSHHTVQRWQRGFVPNEPEHIAILICYCVKHGRMDRTWAAGVLQQAHYPEREALLAELFPERPSRSAPPHVYQNLPPRAGEFLGREADMDRMLEGLASRWPLLSIEGMSGIGKTTLAIEIARGCLPGPSSRLDPPFAAIVWISAKDRPDQKCWLNDVLDTVARVLDYPYITQLPPEQKPTEVDTLLRTQRVLVVVDNFETIEDPALVAWMQRVPEPSKVLITCRYAQLRSVWDIHLRGLEAIEALCLIRSHARRLGLHKIAKADDDDLSPLARVTEGNPKAIELALGHVKYSGLSLSEVVDHLHHASQTVNDIFIYLFAHAWTALTEDARHLLLVVPFFVDAARKEALGAAAGLSGYRLDVALAQLTEMALLDADGELNDMQRRYSTHPLTRASAGVKLQEVSDWERAAREQWIVFYMDFVEQHGTQDWDEPSHFQQFEVEWQNLLAVAEWLYQAQEQERMYTFVTKTTPFMHACGEWDQRIALTRRALELAESADNQERVCWFRASLGYVLALRDRFEEAEYWLQLAYILARQSQEFVLLDNVYLGLTILGQRMRNSSVTYTYLLLWQALTQAPENETRPAVRRSIVFIAYRRAIVAYINKDLELARQLFEEVVKLGRETSWERMIAYGLNYLADLAISCGDLSAARHYLGEGWTLVQRWRDKRRTANFRYSFALLEQADGRLDDALDQAHQALDLFHRLGMSREEGETAELIAHLGKAQE